METIDDRPDNFPEEAINDMKSMCSWMTFSGVMMIIFAILGILGNLTMVSGTSGGSVLISILTNGVSVYLGFLLIKKSGAFNRFSDGRDDKELADALKANYQFWMISTIMVILSFVLTIAIK